jgi:excisionase family DNA binding protein
MANSQKTLSVSQVAALCGVGRTTVGYWIRSKKLRANRTGRNYSIPVQDLLFFLKSSGQKIPSRLHDENLKGPIFKSYQHCWEFWKSRNPMQNCEKCIAFKRQLEVCFTARNSRELSCSIECEVCPYYHEIFLPRIQFVDQIDAPAAVFKDLYLWCGNEGCTEICGVAKKDLVGLGIEKIVHPSSLEKVISYAKEHRLGNIAFPTKCALNLKNSQSSKIAINTGIYPLTEPEKAFLVLVESVNIS